MTKNNRKLNMLKVRRCLIIFIAFLILLISFICIKINRENCFYCAEFIKYVFEKSDIKTNLPELITPEDFLNIPNSIPIYNGYLSNYN